MLKLAIVGAAGRMGCALIRAAGLVEGVTVTAAVERAGHPALGEDAGAVAGRADLGVALQSEIGGDGDGDRDFDLMLDFTTPAATMEHLAACRRLSRGMVIGTTGLGDDFEAAARDAAAALPLIVAANTSVGVNLCLALVETAAAALGARADVEIIEAHHRHKVDARYSSATASGLKSPTAPPTAACSPTAPSKPRNGWPANRRAFIRCAMCWGSAPALGGEVCFADRGISHRHARSRFPPPSRPQAVKRASRVFVFCCFRAGPIKACPRPRAGDSGFRNGEE